MSDELRAAAERLLKGPRAYRGTTHKEQLDVWSIADAWLHEHPAEDGEAINPTWLESLGFRWCNGEQCFLLPVDESEHPDCLCYYCDRHATLGRRGAEFAMKTRGSLRRLCAALGIRLAEGEQA